MVEQRGCRNFDHSSETLWQNFKHEHAGIFFSEKYAGRSDLFEGLSIWEELTAYIRALFNNTFKTNPYLERAIMTEITRVSKESIFSDLNNPNVVTTTSKEYATDRKSVV